MENKFKYLYLVSVPSFAIESFVYSFKEKLPIGAAVIVKLRGKLRIGYIIDIISDKTKDDFDFEIFDIEKVLDPIYFLTEEQYNILKWISKLYINLIGRTLDIFIPKGLKLDKNGEIKYKPLKSFFISLNPEKIDKLNEIFDSLKDEYKEVINKLKEYKEIRLSEISEFEISKYRVDKLIKEGFIIKYKKEYYRKIIPEDLKKIKKEIPPLNKEQNEIFEKIKKTLKTHKKHLIFGITGSGKTRIYIHLINEVIQSGKQALVLVPEVGLTPQLFQEFYSVFRDQVIFYHSKLNSNERHEIWLGIKRGDYKIVVGTRSSIFLPFTNLGIIIIDEEHDQSYIQDDQSPFYNGKNVAFKIGKDLNIPVVIGSATPSVETYYLAKQRKIELHKLFKRATYVEEPEVKIIDLKKVKTEEILFSIELLTSIKRELNKNKRVILFFNRRGFFTFFMCDRCKKILECPFCSKPLVYHKDEAKFKCHICGYETSIKPKCSCGGEFKEHGIGIQQIEEYLIKFFDVKVIRMDADTVNKKKFGHKEIIEEFKNTKPSILLGTQMITKGYDIKDVSLVGVILADQAMGIPDYKANERGFQLITQTIGRSGREKEKGLSIIQTFDSENRIFDFILNKKYEEFYKYELSERKKFKYPPFVHLSLIIITHKKEEYIIKESNIVYSLVRKIKDKFFDKNIYLEIIGPYNPLIYKKEGRFYKFILIKSENIKDASNILNLTKKTLSKTSIKSKVIFKLEPLFIV